MDLQKDSERGRKRTLTHFTRALKDAGLLLPMAVRENQEVTVSSRNICKWPLGTCHNGLGHNVMWHNGIRYNFKNEK